MRMSRIVALSCVVVLSAALVSGVAFADDEPKGGAELAAATGYALEQEPAPVENDPETICPSVMRRLYNIRTGEHFYTASNDEYNSLVEAGWFGEGIGWVAPNYSSTPVYRLYNPYSGDHHYTTGEQERDQLVAAGWSDEGIGWYSDDRKSVPLFRQYNPNVAIGSHNFTASQGEKDALVSAGWSDEGEAWYAVAGGISFGMNHYSRNNLQAIVDTTYGADWITVGYNTWISDDQFRVLYDFIDLEPSVRFMAINFKTGKCIAYRPDMRLFSASSAKAPFIAALCKYEAPGIAGYQDVLYDVITNSSNEAFAYLNTIYDKSYVTAFAREAGFEYDSPFYPAYAYYSPREIVKLWIDIHDFIYSDAPYATMYRNLFGRGAIYKEGWMYPIAWCGQIYNLTGSEGDMVYGIMSSSSNQSPNIWALRDTLVSITS